MHDAQWPTCARDTDSDAEITADFAHRATHLAVARGGRAAVYAAAAISFGFDWLRLMSRATRV